MRNACEQLHADRAMALGCCIGWHSGFIAWIVCFYCSIISKRRTRHALGTRQPTHRRRASENLELIDKHLELVQLEQPRLVLVDILKNAPNLLRSDGRVPEG